MAVSDVQHQKRFEHVVRKQNKRILLDINCLTRGLFLCFQLTGDNDKHELFSVSVLPSPRGAFSLGLWQLRLTAARSTSCSRTRSPRPCCSCLPSSCHRSWAGTGHSPPPAARRTECRQSPCRSRLGATPDTGKTPRKSPWDNCCTSNTHYCPKKGIFNWV